MAALESVVEDRAFLEGPRWHDGALWVSDMHAHEVLRVDAAGAVEVVARLDGPPSGLGWLPDGRMLVVSMHDRRVLRLEADGATSSSTSSPAAVHSSRPPIPPAWRRTRSTTCASTATGTRS